MGLPELFGPYLLLQRMADGATSEVYLAQTTGDFPRLCAVKRVRPEAAALPGFAERFRRDAGLLVRLIHGNLVQVLEVGAVEERLFVAMELIDGVDHAELVARTARQGPLPPELALYVGLELCEASSYVQQHRREASGAVSFPADSPWSLEVMLSFDGVVKLVDLGSFGAVHLGAQKVSRLLQSPGYAVPEVILRRPLDLRSDLFAIGLVVWELLTGQRLVGADPESYVRQVLSGQFKAPFVQRKDVAGDVIRLVGELLALDPARRPPGIEAVRGRLVSALRRVAPAYGAAALSRLLYGRCPDLVQLAERRVTEGVRRSGTEQDLPRAAPTLSFGQARAVSRQVGPPAPLRVGDPIPGTRYRVVRFLGEGGSAQVYAAQHVDLERQVAMKILSPQLAASSAAIAQFRLEARACSRVRHPNIVDVVDFGELDDGRFYFAMELVEGESLADLLDRRCPLSPAQAIGIFRQIARALAATHQHRIVHRDLKPENVMLVERDGRRHFVKLLDFGVMAFGAEECGRAVGTTGYMAPEQVRGERPSPAMDIYALGTTLYEVLAGAVPYPAQTFEEFARKQALGPFPPLRSHPAAADVPEALEAVIHRALAADAAERQGSMEELEADLVRAQWEAGIVTEWDDLPLPPGVEPPPLDPLELEATVERVLPGPRPGAAAQTGPAAEAGGAGLAAGAGGAARTGLAAEAGAGVVGGPTVRPSAEAEPGPPHGRARRAWPYLAALTLVGAVAALVSLRPGPATQAPPRPLPRHPGVRPLPAPPQRAALAEDARRSLLDQVEQAVAQGHFTHPAGQSALDLLARLEADPPSRPRVDEMKQRIAGLLDGAGDRVFDAGMRSAARTLYTEARLFAPGSPARLARLAELERAAPAEKRSPRPTAELAEVAWLLSQIQLAVVDGRYVRPARQNALELLVRLKQLDPDGDRSRQAQERMTRELRARADALWGAGKPAEARPLYRLVVLLSPDDGLARGRATGGGADAGAARVRVASEGRDPVDPERAQRLLAEGNALLQAGDLSSAEVRYQGAFEANPREVRALTGLASVAFERALYPKAVELARRAIRMDPRGTQGYLLLGEACFKLLRYGEARAAWERVLELEPQNAKAARRLRHLPAPNG